jgi:hypothetical protein
MVTIKLMGGLGNQMFQYAAGRRLAWAHQVLLKLDISFFDYQKIIAPNGPYRNYSLCHFNIHEIFATPKELKWVSYAWQKSYQAKLFRFIQRKIPIRFMSIYQQKTEGFDQNVLKLGKNIYLDGYWQSWKYFDEIKDIIRQEFSLRGALHQENQRLADKIKATTAVGIHIRRGDYVSDPIPNKYHGVCDLDYYYNGITLLTKTMINPHFFIFSDDPQWVSENLTLNYPMTMVKNNGSERDYEDFYLMTLCKHFIVANSSFSWWGAWLSQWPGKIVICPQHWVATPRKEPLDLIPSTWIRL